MKIVINVCLILFFSISCSFGQKPRLLDINDVLGYSFYSKRLHGTYSMKDGKHFSVLDSYKNTVYIHDYATGGVTDSIQPPLESTMSEYAFSSNEQKVLMTTNTQNIYRHSFTADYYIYDLKTNKLTKLSADGSEQLATFSPQGNKVAYVKNNNIYIKNLESGVTLQTTKDGKRNEIIYGAPDWVYEEEFGFSKAFEWSPDGKYLAYYRFDERKVKEFSMQVYDGLYPSVNRFKYPKAGEQNSLVEIFLYNVSTTGHVKVDIGKETDIYIPRIKWTITSDYLSVSRLNRLQNKLEVLLATPMGKTSVLYTEINKYFYDYKDLDNLTFLPSGKHFSITSEKNGFRHLYLFDMKGNEIRQLSKGNFDLTSFYGFDVKRKLFYIQAAAIHPSQREVYSIDWKGKRTKKLSQKNGTNEAKFSNDFSFFINEYSTANSAFVTTLHNNKGDEIRTLVHTPNMKKRQEQLYWQPREFFSFVIEDSVQLNAWMIKPFNFDSMKQYPVFMYQYSGPGSQTVKDTYGRHTEWFQLLAQQGYIVVSVDGRGTGARGEKFRKMTYLKLGKYESKDQIQAAKYFQGLPYVDSSRIGIYGWSYGGFMSTACLAKAPKQFKMGIAVAPVTNWRYYDNIYTERYMRTPRENPNGYDDNSPINFVSGIKGKFLLIHGTGDDNVHLTNTIELSKELIRSGVDFDYMLYPNENHSIRSSSEVSMHLYLKMTRFILKNL